MPMANHALATQEDKRLIWSLYIFFAVTTFMAFTTECEKGFHFNDSATVFNKIQIQKSIRSNFYFLLNDLILLPVFYRRKKKILKLGFGLFAQKFIYNLGLLLEFYEFNKGYSDFLNIGIIASFLIYDTITEKWNFQSKL